MVPLSAESGDVVVEWGARRARLGGWMGVGGFWVLSILSLLYPAYYLSYLRYYVGVLSALSILSNAVPILIVCGCLECLGLILTSLDS